MSHRSDLDKSRWRRKPVSHACARRSQGLRAAARGFTLIELLVVVAIITLLMSILLPSLSNAREQGKRAVCMSNMRQMGIAFLSYSLENREYVPTCSCPLSETEYDKPEDYYWLNILQRYSKQPLISRCRNDKTQKPYLDWSDAPPKEEWQNYRWSSYAVNVCVGPLTSPLAIKRVSEIKQPSHVVFLAEVRAGDSYDAADHIHSDLWENQDAPEESIAWQRHRDKSNYLFVDSHVDSLHWKKTWDFPLVNMWWPQHAPGWPPELLPPRP